MKDEAISIFTIHSGCATLHKVADQTPWLNQCFF